MSGNNYITNYRKFAELLIYVLSKFDDGLNETKMLKLLYFADADNYERNGKTISDVIYYKNHFGPTPNYNILQGLYVGLGEYVDRNSLVNDNRKVCKVRLKDANYKFKTLTAEDMEVIDSTIDKYGKLPISDVVRLSHFDPPYLSSEKTKKIDFSLVSFRKSDEDFEEQYDEELRSKIANDITPASRRKLKTYVGASS